MHKIIFSVLIALFCFTFLACADLLNDKYPEEAVSLAKAAGTSYTDSSRKPFKSSIVSGELDSQTTQIIYAFETFASNNTYNISWENRTGQIAVSVSKYPDFRFCIDGFENDTSKNHDFSITGRTNVYVRVTAAPYSYSTDARFILKITGQVDILELNKME